MDLKLNFPKAPEPDKPQYIAPEQISMDVAASVTTETVKSDNAAILCQNCHEAPRANSQSLLCETCKKGTLPVPAPIEQINATMPVTFTDNSNNNVRQIDFAPMSIRYEGKQLDEIAWSMLPALPDDMLIEMRAKMNIVLRDIAEKEPTIQELDLISESFRYLSDFTKQLSVIKKDKLMLSARPEMKRLEKERKEQEKAKKVQSSIPKDVISRHTANIILAGIVEITAPLEKEKQAILKRFLDHVQLQSQIEETIDREWIKANLNKPNYAPLKPYLTIKTEEKAS